jgi:predicted AAA+ superfamily ATPase
MNFIFIPLMIERKTYVDALAKWRGERVIKIVTGIRRCGKSTLLV